MSWNPGEVWLPNYHYDPRFPWGQGLVKVVSFAAATNIGPGTMVEVLPNETIQPATGAHPLGGVAVFDPGKYYKDVIYNQFDMVPVLRVGSVFVLYTGVGDFPDPEALEEALFYAGTGIFTNDPAGVACPQAVFSIASQEYYSNGDGSPAADIPFPSVPPPPGTINTIFPSGAALIDLNL